MLLGYKIKDDELKLFVKRELHIGQKYEFVYPSRLIISENGKQIENTDFAEEIN